MIAWARAADTAHADREGEGARGRVSVEADNHAKILYVAEWFIYVPGGEADGVVVRVLA